jgi:hypothetical protein
MNRQGLPIPQGYNVNSTFSVDQYTDGRACVRL